MVIRSFNILFIALILIIFSAKISLGEVLKKIEITGNDRISDDTIKLFSEISLNSDLKKENLNEILKKLYETNFFQNVSIKFENNTLFVNVEENPIIENINYQGIKKKKLIDLLKNDALIKSRSSYNEYLVNEEKKRLLNTLKNIGYYNADVDIYVENQENNLIELIIKFNLGSRAKIKKITFLGNKIFKDNKLKRVIASSEYKYWKFLSGRKFLNENMVEFDKRLLKNYYKNNGYYNAEVNSSFARMINEDEFELIFNIDAQSKIYFGELKLNLPSDFDENNFLKIKKLFEKIEVKNIQLTQ